MFIILYESIASTDVIGPFETEDEADDFIERSSLIESQAFVLTLEDPKLTNLG